MRQERVHTLDVPPRYWDDHRRALTSQDDPIEEPGPRGKVRVTLSDRDLFELRSRAADAIQAEWYPVEAYVGLKASARATLRTVDRYLNDAGLKLSDICPPRQPEPQEPARPTEPGQRVVFRFSGRAERFGTLLQFGEYDKGYALIQWDEPQQTYGGGLSDEPKWEAVSILEVIA